MNLQQFRNFNATALQLDDLVALAAFGRALREEYEKLTVDEPDWVDVQLKSLKREIHARIADKLEARRKEIDISLDRMKSPTQRKLELLKEKARIDKQLEEVGV